ncbi:unnamed protein product [Adineta steineri]|uniref:Chitin-binding type-2 domain-containing protein n=1 Tax=Adineta steineri TaxID=433720 RepID=A0A815R7C2_9BILA|nr:unnamed protein product [Adineta steineri]CAF1472765.1 unnamed protein product [Adineta steineri]
MTTIKSIECLPNELWLLFMSFLPPIDLYRALAGLNHRINYLLSSMTPRPVLDTSQCAGDGIYFSNLHQLIAGKDIWSQFLLSSIDTIRLYGTLAGDALFKYYQSPKHLSSNPTSFSHSFPSLRRLYITEISEKIEVSQLLIPLSTTLSDVYFTFAAPMRRSSYYKVVNDFTNHSLSFYRMVFDVEDDDIGEDTNSYHYGWKRMYLPNTVYLSLCIKRLDDLFNLLDTQALPVLDHLSVVFITRDLKYDAEMVNVNNITSRLRSLKLRYMSMNNLLVFLSSVHMPLLEKLTLIDIHDNTLNRLSEFQKYFETKTNLPGLRPSSFRFLLRFPGELESKWNTYRYLQWPLDVVNIDHCLEEHRLSTTAYYRSRALSLPKKYSLLIFTRSSLPSHRIIHNYSAAVTLKQTSSIKWTCDYIDNSEQVFEVLSNQDSHRRCLSMQDYGLLYTEQRYVENMLRSFHKLDDPNRTIKRKSMFQICLLYCILTIQNVISKNSEFVCPQDGRWPHPTDCEKYYTCNTGISIEGWCGTGMTYDPEHKRCDLSKNIDCQNGERPGWTPPEGWGQSESVTSYVITKTTKSFDDDDDDNKNEVVKKTTRTPKRRKTTTRPATIATKAARLHVTLSISQLIENSECTFQGHMPDPDNCQTYYACREDVVTRVHCPEKQLFDEDTRICNDYRKVFCANRPVNERGYDPCIGQQNGWYVDNENQCRSYYLCTEQRKTKMGECTSGFKWNSAKLRCDDPRNIAIPCGLRSNNAIPLFHQHYLTIVIIFSSFSYLLTY